MISTSWSWNHPGRVADAPACPSWFVVRSGRRRDFTSGFQRVDGSRSAATPIRHWLSLGLESKFNAGSALRLIRPTSNARATSLRGAGRSVGSTGFSRPVFRQNHVRVANREVHSREPADRPAASLWRNEESKKRRRWRYFPTDPSCSIPADRYTLPFRGRLETLVAIFRQADVGTRFSGSGFPVQDGWFSRRLASVVVARQGIGQEIWPA